MVRGRLSPSGYTKALGTSSIAAVLFDDAILLEEGSESSPLSGSGSFHSSEQCV